MNKSLSLWSPLGLTKCSSYCEISHKATWPLIHPPAIIFGSVGENANENISSGASSNSFNFEKLSFWF